MNAATYQGYSSYRFWIIKGKTVTPTPPPSHEPTQIRVKNDILKYTSDIRGKITLKKLKNKVKQNFPTKYLLQSGVGLLQKLNKAIKQLFNFEQ